MAVAGFATEGAPEIWATLVQADDRRVHGDRDERGSTDGMEAGSQPPRPVFHGHARVEQLGRDVAVRGGPAG